MSDYAEDARLKLTTVELDRLQSILDGGDRAGFYMAYYAMSENVEALLTAKISSFSETVGSTALAANWLLEYSFGAAGGPRLSIPEGSSAVYQGVYNLSQNIAQAALDAVVDDRNTEDARSFDGYSDGLITQNRMFISAFDLWSDAGNRTMFPGQALISDNYIVPARDFSIPDWSSAQATAAVGTDYSYRAALYANFVESDRGQSPATLIGPDDYRIVVDASGRVQGVYEAPGSPSTVEETFANIMSALGAATVAAYRTTIALGPIQDLALWLGERFVTMAADVVLGPLLAALTAETREKVTAAWLSELPVFEQKLAEMLTAPADSFPSAPTIVWRANGTSNDDVLQVSGGELDAGSGDDLVFGDHYAETIRGGAGDDIIFSKDDSDLVQGDDGNDIIRGGTGNDTLSGGRGNDLLSGGDLLSRPSGPPANNSPAPLLDGIDYVDYRAAAGPVGPLEKPLASTRSDLIRFRW